MRPILSALLLILLTSCYQLGKLTHLADLPRSLEENSGIITLKDSLVWVIADRGNKDEIYQVDLNGNLLRKLKVKNAKNIDWEDLAMDTDHNVFIGDFGNNNNKRRDLTIYKLPNPEIEKGEKIAAEVISFKYPDQKQFPPVVGELNYDAEAFFHHNNALYIITKNRTVPFTGQAFIYKVPDRPGINEAEFIGKFITCKQEEKCQVTAADISPDGSTIALLGYGRLWIFTAFEWDDFSKGQLKTINLGIATQLESICFLNNETLLLSDEVQGDTGGNLYSFKIPK